VSRFDPEYTVEWAKDLAKECRKIQAMVGPQAVYPYLDYQLVAAILALYDVLQMNEDASREALTLCRRQYAALNARYSKLCKKHGEAAEIPSDA
jgi:hypothetical protein